MKTRQIVFLVLVGLNGLWSNAQNVQSNALGTSGGLQAGTTTSGVGSNTFYGFQAGKNNTIGYANTFVGATAGFSNLNGLNNVVVGAAAASTESLGSGNVFIGSTSGQGNTGNGNVMIGSSSGGETTNNGSYNVFIGNQSGFSEEGSNKLIIGHSEDNKELITGDFALRQLKLAGKVGIGYAFGNYPTTSGSVNISKYNLFVKGGLLAEEVRVSLASTWADYVFAKDYKLPTLQEVEKQIQDNGHLFNVPSAKQVAADGIDLGEMAKIQQEKIEELTLYLIQQNKEIELLKSKNKELEELKTLVKSLIEKNK